jgi:hypothetical protein
VTASAHAQEAPKKKPAAADTTRPTQPRKPPRKEPVDRRKLEAWGEHRVMGGHVFPFATFVDTPFAASYIGVTGGIEYHRVPRVSKPIAFLGDSGTERVDLQTVNVAETLDFELRLHDLFALFGSTYGRARVGVNAPTLLGNGGDYRYGGSAGGLLRILRVDSFQLSLRAELGFYSGQQAGILGLFRDLGNIVDDAFARIIANPMVDLASTLALVNNAFRSATQELLVPFDGYRYGVSLNAAQAFGRYLGVQLALGFIGETAFFHPRIYDATRGGTIVSEQQSTTLAGRAAFALDLDGAPAGVPLDLMLEYALTLGHEQTSAPNTSSDTVSTEQLVALGLYYSGRPDLQLGGTVYTLVGQLPLVAADRSLSGSPIDAGALFVFRYIW